MPTLPTLAAHRTADSLRLSAKMNFIWWWYACMNLLGFGLAASDKFAAKMGHRRTAHATFCSIATAGGFLGSVAAFAVFNHKTRHHDFQGQFAVATAGHLGALLLLHWVGVLGWLLS